MKAQNMIHSNQLFTSYLLRYAGVSKRHALAVWYGLSDTDKRHPTCAARAYIVKYGLALPVVQLMEQPNHARR